MDNRTYVRYRPGVVVHEEKEKMVITDDTSNWLGRLHGAPLPVLLTLYTGGRLSQAQIVRATGFKPQTVREALHVLEMHNLVAALQGDRWVITQEGDGLVAQLQRRRGS